MYNRNQFSLQFQLSMNFYMSSKSNKNISHIKKLVICFSKVTPCINTNHDLSNLVNVNAVFLHCLVWMKYLNIFVAVNGGFRTNFTPVHYMIAVYSYNPIELSPNIDADVSDLVSLHCMGIVWLGRLTYVVRPFLYCYLFYTSYSNLPDNRAVSQQKCITGLIYPVSLIS